MASVPAWQLSRKRHFCEWVEWKGHGHTERTHLEPTDERRDRVWEITRDLARAHLSSS